MWIGLTIFAATVFFTGVVEGNIGSARIIKMLDVKDDELVVESRGIYSIENFLMSRRLMYWQVYLHKTAVAAEKMMINTLRRAKELSMNGEHLLPPPALSYFCQMRPQLPILKITAKHSANLSTSMIMIYGRR